MTIHLAAMLEKEKWTRKRNAIICTHQGSGYHDKDPLSPQKLGKAKLSEHVICFREEHETYFVSESAKVAYAAIQAYASETVLADTATPAERVRLRTAKEYAEAPLADGVLEVRNVQCNTVFEILTERNLGITSTDTTPFPDDDEYLLHAR